MVVNMVDGGRKEGEHCAWSSVKTHPVVCTECCTSGVA